MKKIYSTIIWFYLIAKYAFPWRKPLYVIRLLYAAVRVRLLHQSLLRGVDFSIGFACNLKCKHCFNSSLDWGGDHRPRMAIKDYGRVVKEAMQLGCITFALQGGEPLVYPSLEEIVKVLRPQWNRVVVTTNAALLTRARLLSLKSAGVDTISVSLDSGNPEEHDQLRGAPGTFDKAVKSLLEAQALGFAVSINMTLSRSTLYSDGFIKLLEFAHSQKIMINTLFAAPAGNWRKSQHFLMRPEDIVYYDKIIQRYPFAKRDIDITYGSRGCSAVNEMFYITNFGDVLACPFIHISLGNVLQEPLAKIRERGLGTYLFGRHHPRCWISEEQEFMQAYISLMAEKERLPIAWDSPEGRSLLYDFRLGEDRHLPSQGAALS